MVSINHYELKSKPDSKILYVESHEMSVCPICNGSLGVIGSRKRSVILSSGEKRKLMIRRLKCIQCDKIHHELPDCVVPYKRYVTKAIEEILTKNSASLNYACEEGTVRRLKNWFSTLKDTFEKTLISIKAVHNYDPEICNTINELLPINSYLSFADGWLKTLVRLLVNSSRWPQTRSA